MLGYISNQSDSTFQIRCLLYEWLESKEKLISSKVLGKGHEAIIIKSLYRIFDKTDFDDQRIAKISVSKLIRIRGCGRI